MDSKQLSQPVVVREHRITTREGLAGMMQLGVKNIPTICVDGSIVFSSLIPDQKTLCERLERAIAAKGQG